MSFVYKNCSACSETELTLVDSSYLGEWAEHIYKCKACGYQETVYFDYVYHLTPIATNSTTNEKNTNHIKELQERKRTTRTKKQSQSYFICKLSKDDLDLLNDCKKELALARKYKRRLKLLDL
jgi:hypothetical protein